MRTLGLSPLEMRQIVEAPFLPLRCECLEEPSGALTVRIHDPLTDHIDLEVKGVSHERFSSSYEIACLVKELHYQLSHPHPLLRRAG